MFWLDQYPCKISSGEGREEVENPSPRKKYTVQRWENYENQEGVL
jgi:hypothetical protein